MLVVACTRDVDKPALTPTPDETCCAEPLQISVPIAKRVLSETQIHGYTYQDYYHWMKDTTRKDPEVIQHLKDENGYTDHTLRNQVALRSALAQESLDSMDLNEQSVPVRIGPYFYFSKKAE